MAHCCVRAYITGKVQGVWYRRATQEQALMRGLTGYAKNLPDGRVEVLMCGPSSAVAELSQWLWQGPEGARLVCLAGKLVILCLPRTNIVGG